MATTQATFGELDESESEPESEPTEERIEGTPVGGFPRRIENTEAIEPGYSVTIDSAGGQEYEIVAKTGSVLTLESEDTTFRFAGTGPDFQKFDGRFTHELYLTGFTDRYEYPTDPYAEESEPILGKAPETRECMSCALQVIPEEGYCPECGEGGL